MPTFTYIGTTTEGTSVTETVQAEDRFAVYEIARQAGHQVERVAAKKTFSLRGIFNVEKIEYAISRVKNDELVMVTRNLGAMLKAGLPLSRALQVLQRQTKNPRLRLVTTDIVERLNRGSQLYEALAEHPKIFDDLYISMIQAGEESGGLAESLDTLSVQMERTSSLKKKIKGAMIYPTIIIIILVLIGILMMVYVMPSITDTFKSLDVDLPVATQVLMNISDFMNNNLILTIGGLIAFVVGVIASLRTLPGRWFSSWIIPRLPIIGTMAKETNAARTARTLSSLLSSGVDVIRALEITGRVVQNLYYRDIILEASKRVENGSPLSEVFVEREDLYPILVGEMILVGEETGKISQMMKDLAIFYENEVEQKTKDLSTIIEPILMVVIGGVVGFFALAMIAPIYSIGDSI